QVEKQVKCGRGRFVDTGFVTNNEDGTGSCIGWNAGNGMAAEAISVQYAVKNTGTTQLFGCTVSDSNPAISSGPIALGDVAIGGSSPQTPAGALTCSDLLALNEPDTATLSCFCTADKNPSFVATAKDIAKFQCETPGLTVTKTCVVQAADGANEVDVTVTNTSPNGVDLANCTATDTVFPQDPTCPPDPTHTGTPVPLDSVPQPF